MKKFLPLVLSAFLTGSLILSGNSVSAQLSGTYSINAGTPTSGSNFNSFSAAVSALENNGVNGAVTFIVVSNSGPYGEQIDIGKIPGVSSSNTVTFNGNGNTVSTNPTSNRRFLIRLKGAKYVTFDNLYILDSSATYGFGILLSDSADYNTVKNCTIDLTNVTSSSSGNSVGIVASGDSNSTTSSGYNANYCTFLNNVIKGGASGMYYGIRLNGTSGSTGCVGNLIKNNEIRDFYSTAIYLDNCYGTEIDGNDIHRPNKTGTTSFYGMYLISSKDTEIHRNKIHNTHDNTSSSTTSYCYFLTNCNSSSGNETRIYNNIIYNLNCNSNIYAFYHTGSDYAQYYYNTVYLDNTSATTGYIYGFYTIGSASNVDFKNNIVYITHGGNGDKYAMYMGTSNTINTDYNDLYMNSQGSGAQYIGRYLTNDYLTLSSWKTALSGAFDQHSKSENPLFANPSNGNLTPSSGSIDNTGLPISGITTDYLGLNRSSSTPDPGAFEFTSPANDAGVVNVTEPSAPCPGTHSVKVAIKNFGAATLDSVTVNWKVNGVLQIPVSFTPSLNPGNTTTVTIGSLNVTATGTYNIKSWTSFPNGGSDANVLNDTFLLNGLASALSGTFTIGPSGNYTTIVSAVNDLNGRGLCGPVVYNVTPNSGPYSGKIEIGPVAGNSSVNTIKFHGNGNTISDVTTTDDRHIVRLNGAKYLTFDNFNIVCNSSLYGYAVHLMNSADYDSIINCTIDMTSHGSSSLSNGAGIVASSSKINTSGLGTSANYCVFMNNDILGGSGGGMYYGIILNGGTGVNTCNGNQIINNNIYKAYSEFITLNYTTGTVIRGNDISRAGKSTVGGNFYGVYCNYANSGIRVEQNKIHDSHTSTTASSGSVYAIYFNNADGTSPAPNIVSNNLIYNINNTGRAYAIYNSSSDYAYYYYNTIHLSGSPSSSSPVRGFYQGGTAVYMIFKNNIISIEGAGSGSKYAFDLGSTPNSLVCDYNDIYMNSSGTGTEHVGRYGNTDYHTLANWRTANSGVYDQNSDSLDPQFMNSSAGDFTPQSNGMNNMCLPVPGISVDIFDVTRNPNKPDPGAIEYTPIPDNDSCQKAITITSGITYGTTERSTPDTAISCVATNDSAGGVWYKYVGKGDFVVLSLCGSSYNTQVRVFTGSCSNFECVTGNNDSCSTQSKVSWCAYDGTDYYILVYGDLGEEGEFELNLTETAIKKAVVTPNGSTEFCDGQSVSLVSSSASAYKWNDINTSTTNFIIATKSGNYRVVTTDAKGCRDTSEFVTVTVLPLPNADLGGDRTICTHHTITLSPQTGTGYTYKWNTGATSSSIQFSGHTTPGSHTVSVIVTDTNGCVGSDEITIEVIYCVGIEEHNSNFNFSISPNPSDGSFTVEFNQAVGEPFDLSITDLQGRQVYNRSVEEVTGGLVEKINIHDLNSGLYVIRVDSREGSISKRLIVR